MPAGVTTAADALERLREGNRRFAAGLRSMEVLATHTRRADLLAGQQPFAIVLGCSDSRVPAEIVFDQGLGDLFVIRVAGNIVAPSQVGSVEFAATRFETRLVVVLGHSQCGAIAATLEELSQPGGIPSRNLRSIVSRIRPSVEALLATDLKSRSGRARPRSRQGERPSVGGPSAARIRDPRGPHRRWWRTNRGRGVFSGDRDCGFPRRRAGSALTAGDRRWQGGSSHEWKHPKPLAAGCDRHGGDRACRGFCDAAGVAEPPGWQKRRGGPGERPGEAGVDPTLQRARSGGLDAQVREARPRRQPERHVQGRKRRPRSPVRQVDGVRQRIRPLVPQAALLVLQDRGRVSFRRRAIARRAGVGHAQQRTHASCA